jgi:hypothetical protein
MGGPALKRITALALALAMCLALLAPGAAMAKKIHYRGKIKPSGTLQFDLLKKNHKTSIVHFKWKSMPIDCKAGANTSTGNLTYRVKVKHHQFDTTARANGQGTNAKAHITGKLDGRHAKGTISISGKKVPVDNPPSPDKCSTGKLRWKAHK